MTGLAGGNVTIFPRPQPGLKRELGSDCPCHLGDGSGEKSTILAPLAADLRRRVQNVQGLTRDRERDQRGVKVSKELRAKALSGGL